jgi:hypothetical protein
MPKSDLLAWYSCEYISDNAVALKDFRNYLDIWENIAVSRQQGSPRFQDRSRATSSIFSGVTVRGSWTELPLKTIAANFQKFQRFIDNVTNYMPNSIIVLADQDIINRIPQPLGFSGFGDHTIYASVKSTTSNTLCVNANKSELAPLICSEWPFATNSESLARFLSESWRNSYNKTLLDDIFEWGLSYDDDNKVPPVFASVSKKDLIGQHVSCCAYTKLVSLELQCRFSTG